MPRLWPDRPRWEAAADFDSRLEAARLARGVTQEDLAKAIGIGTSTYRRFEQQEILRPPLAYFVNCAMVLDVPIGSLIDDDYLLWTQLSDNEEKEAPLAPPEDPKALWRLRDRNPDLPPA